MAAKRDSAGPLIGSLGRYRPLMAWIALLVVVVGSALAFDARETNRFQAQSAAGQSLTRSRIVLNRLAGEILRLSSTAAGSTRGEALAQAPDMLRRLTEAMDVELGALGSNAARGADGTVWTQAFAAEGESAQLRSQVLGAWSDYRTRLRSLIDDPRVASDARTTAIAAIATAGLSMERDLERLEKLVASEAELHARRFRIVQYGAIGLATTIFLMIAFFVVRVLRGEDAALAAARAETNQILDTVNEGLFLLDEQIVVGGQRSRALERLLRRDDVAGRGFAELLEPLVGPQMTKTAVDYVAMLWGERVNENLVKSLNPLAEAEVTVATETGNSETRHYAFDFTRVRIAGTMKHVLVTVLDVTDRVLLARELAAATRQQQNQLDVLLSVLQIEPTQLAGFLGTAEAAMSLVNSVMKQPARELEAFREKLDKIFREIHTLKAEAAALGLRTIEERAHRFEDSLSLLRAKSTLTGNDFLPLAVKLDELFSHLGSVRNLVSRLGELRVAIGTGAAPPHTPTIVMRRDDEAPAETTQRLTQTDAIRAVLGGRQESLEEMLRRFADRIATEHGKRVSLVAVGLEQIPAFFAKPVQDILTQFVRNAIAHGIETPDERRAAGKQPEGTLALEFADLGDQGYELTFQDDGRGIDHERIRATALERGLITPEVAASTDPRKLVKFIFKPGFSTAGDVSRDAGRGVGMDVVRDLVVRLGGRISISTRSRQFTRFRIALPTEGQAAVA